MLGQSKPLVSIIIPVYNGSDYIAEAIDSALNQTYENCEVIVVNDGSTDVETEKIALAYGDKIRYFYKSNGGVASALNYGIRQMRGEYFSWLSHDDWYYPYKIQCQIQALKEEKDMTLIVQGEYEFLHMNSGTITPTDFLKSYSKEQITNSFFSVMQLQMHACASLIHKSHFQRVGLFDEKLRTIQDIDMWFRMLRGQKSLFVDKPLIRVREHDKAGSKTIACYHEETGREYLKLIESISFEEMKEVYGQPAIFLCRMAGFLKSYDREEEFDKVKEILKKCEPSVDECEELRQLSMYIKEQSDYQAKEIAIFGAGQYGIRLYYEMKSRMIDIDYFIDNDTNKVGKLIDGANCVSLEQLKGREEEVLVIVATRIVPPILRQLKEAGFKYIAMKQDVDGQIVKCIPALSQKERWMA